MVQVQCPSCEKSYEVPAGTRAGHATCKSCGQIFTLSINLDNTRDFVANRQSSPKPTPSPSSVPPAKPINKLGQYVLKKKLGAGAMGEVYLGYDPALQRDVAIKVLPPAVAEDKELLKRFLQEGRSAAKLHHPNAVIIHQASVHQGRAFLVMELVEGQSLDKVVTQEGPLPWRAATVAIRDAAAGLAAAHEIGLVHRDIKPANLMRAPKGATKVVDFGLARDLTANDHITQPGTILGTPAFMAPEQWSHEIIDPRTDIYALICTYYYLLTGQAPFRAATLMKLAELHRHQPFPDPRSVVPGLPAGICRMLARGASKSRDERHQSAAELVAELDALLSAPGGSLQSRATAKAVADEVVAPPAIPILSVPPRTTVRRRPEPAASLKTALRAARRLPWQVTTVLGGAMAAILCGVVIYIATNTGTIKIELSDPAANVDVQVNGDTVTLIALEKPFHLRAGKNHLKITGEEFRTIARDFTVKRGNNPVVHVELVKKATISPRLEDTITDPLASLFDREWIKNPSCEEPLEEGQIPGWRVITGGWGVGGGEAKHGKYIFHPLKVPEAELRQDISVADLAQAIDRGEVQFQFTGFVRCWPDGNQDKSRIVIELRDDRLETLDTFDSGGIHSVGVWQEVSKALRAQKGTRSISIRLISTRWGGKSNDAYHDALSLKAVRLAKMDAWQNVIKPGVSWEGISDWGGGKTTKSELHCLSSSGANSEWEFVFLEPSPNDTPVPFREKWTGELIRDSEGVFLRLIRFDGKARHKYVLNGGDKLSGRAEDAPWLYRFRMKGSEDPEDAEWLR